MVPQDNGVRCSCRIPCELARTTQAFVQVFFGGPPPFRRRDVVSRAVHCNLTLVSYQLFLGALHTAADEHCRGCEAGQSSAELPSPTLQRSAVRFARCVTDRSTISCESFEQSVEVWSEHSIQLDRKTNDSDCWFRFATLGSLSRWHIVAMPRCCVLGKLALTLGRASACAPSQTCSCPVQQDVGLRSVVHSFDAWLLASVMQRSSLVASVRRRCRCRETGRVPRALPKASTEAQGKRLDELSVSL